MTMASTRQPVNGDDNNDVITRNAGIYRSTTDNVCPRRSESFTTVASVLHANGRSRSVPLPSLDINNAFINAAPRLLPNPTETTESPLSPPPPPPPPTTEAQAHAHPHDDHIQNIVRRWKAQVFVYMRLHNRSYYYYLRMYDWLSYPVIILSGVSSGTVLGSCAPGTRYTSASLSILVIIFASLIRHIRPMELAQIHATSAQSFQVLLNGLQSFLLMPRDLRMNDNEFVQSMKLSIDDLVTRQIDAPASVLRDYEKKYGAVEEILYGDDVVSVAINNAETRNWISDIQNHMLDRTHAPAMINTVITANNRNQTLMRTRDSMAFTDIRNGGLLSSMMTKMYRSLVPATAPGLSSLDDASGDGDSGDVAERGIQTNSDGKTRWWFHRFVGMFLSTGRRQRHHGDNAV